MMIIIKDIYSSLILSYLEVTIVRKCLLNIQINNNFTYRSCSIINISINTHEIH